MKLASWLIVAAAACGGTPDAPDLGPPPAARQVPVASEINPRLLRRFKPLRALADHREDPVLIARAELGKQLFFDPRLSRDGAHACNSCHRLDRGGADQRPLSLGVGDKRGARNTPTVYNAAWHVAQFWDGRASSLEEQVRGPIFNPDEMAMRTAAEVVQVIERIPGYVAGFRRAFPGEPLDFERVTRAIAAFEQTLATPSRWDRYLRGDRTALTRAELDGLKLFADVGCVQCHTGELVGASMFQKIGVAEQWPNQADPGRYAVTRRPEDRMVFKVPSLRNVAVTAPYFHDGSVAELAEAVRMMGRFQLGAELTGHEVELILAWLRTLTGEPPRAVIQPPALP